MDYMDRPSGFNSHRGEPEACFDIPHRVNCVGVHITVVAAPAPGTRLSIMALDTARDDVLPAAMAASPPSPPVLSVYTSQILPTASTKIKSPPPKRPSPS
jgi:hypothetical protein